ncbi:MAG: WecB/TagA/CpsF family glycosyltransferase, partial [Bacteroidota bacterium]|nr:WecB/TagA/CpsF family glycosyltransferase [Bacteroidota bacterium]
MIENHKICALNITLIDEGGLLDAISGSIISKQRRIIDYVNAHTIVETYKNPNLATMMNSFDILHPDGVGVNVASRWLFDNPNFYKRLNGTDFYYQFLRAAEINSWKIFLFGTHEELLDAASNNIMTLFPNIVIAGTHHGYVDINDKQVVDAINSSGADVLFIGLGIPKQEEWIYANKEKIDTTVILSVGGGIDFISGKKTRAPIFLRNRGLEWLFRMI